MHACGGSPKENVLKVHELLSLLESEFGYRVFYSEANVVAPSTEGCAFYEY